MRITAIKPIVVNAEMRNWVFVKVETDQPGLYGWGEATLEWKTRAVVGALEDLTPLILNLDPNNIEQIIRILHKQGFWRMGVIGTTAMSGIEMALWDILGKQLNVPVWKLLGGKVRDKVKLYTHLGLGDMTSVYETMQATPLVEKAQQVIEKGYQALKVIFIPYTHYTASVKQIKHVAHLMQSLREAVGDDIEIMVDFHGRCASTSVAIQYIKALEPYTPMFVEEPIPAGETQGMKVIADKINCPLAAGERLISRQEFEPLINQRIINIAQPDLCHCGGFSEAKKIAAMAEVAGVGLAPHNPLGPLAGTAALHFAVSTPNFVIQEEMVGAVPWYDDVTDNPLQQKDGYWSVPDKPGLGIEINEKEAKKHPFKQEIFHTKHAVLDDGTVVDW